MHPLLNLLWGTAEGRRFLLVKRAGNPKAFGQHFTSNEDAANFALQIDKQGGEIWMAVGLFNQDAETRSQETLYLIRALFLDVDCGEGKAYPTHTDAEIAIDEFARKIGLPQPLLVNSGRGLHCYWILQSPIPHALFTRLALALRAACIKHGVAADHGVTIDSARVLRLPGTHNRKYDGEPLPVDYYSDVNQAPVVTLDSVATALQPYDNPQFVNLIGTTGDEFKVAYDPIPRSAYKVADNCAQINIVRQLRGNVPEPLWYAALGLLAHCEEGRVVCHDWSSGHPSYSASETDNRINRATNYSATTCQKFASVNPDGCNGCPHAGKITSPIILGRKLDGLTEDHILRDEQVLLQPISFEPTTKEGDANVSNSPTENPQLNTKERNVFEAPTNETDNSQPSGAALFVGVEQTTADTGIPSAQDVIAGVQRGFPYLLAKQGVFLIEKNAETGEQDYVRIIHVPLKVERVVKGRVSTEVHLSWTTPTGKAETAVVTGQQLADKRKGAEFFANVALFNLPSVDRVLKYIQAAAQRLAETREPDVMHDTFGWRGDKTFLLGERVIDGNGTSKGYLSLNVPRRMAEGLHIAGGATEWSNLTAQLNRSEWWVHRLVILATLGTPCLKLMGDAATGAIVSLAGNSGTGKTAVTSFALGAWGSPSAMTVAPTSTLNNIMETLRVLNNVPMCINEALGVIPHWQLSDLFYAAANGEAKGRLTRNAALKDAGGWQTVLFLTSNTHVSSLPDSVLNEATRRRVFEVTIDDYNALSPMLAGEMYRVVQAHHGHVGQAFVQMLAARPDYYASRMNQLFDVYAQTIEAKNRFGIWLICAAQVAGEALCSVGGHLQFAWEDVIERALAHLRASGSTLDLFALRIGDTIAEFVNDNTGQFTAHTAKSDFWDEERIRGEVAGRYICDDHGRAIGLAIHRKKLIDYLLKRNLDQSHLDAWVASTPGVEKNKGVRLTKRAAAPIRCVLIPIDERAIITAPTFEVQAQ